MKHEINQQKLRILGVYLLVAVVVVYEWNFVKSGITALPVLNGVIIFSFIFGNLLAWKTLLSLNHEIAALGLIKEAFADTHSSTKTPELMAERRARCEKQGIVLKRPAILGSAFSVLMDEFWRGRSLRFRLETVQMLTGVVEHKLARDRGVLGYVSGLAIFLGLIGTFIGLMEMVHSVGGIVGSLAGADASADAIQNLIKALQAPLTGMAQGFSASLFGLFASLLMGLVGRFAAAASYSVKEHFESWLTSVSQMEDVRRQERGSATVSPQSTAAGLAVAFNATPPAHDAVAMALNRAADAQSEQAKNLEHLAERFEALAINHAALDEIMRRTDRLAEEMQRIRESTTQEHLALRMASEDGFAVLHKAVGEHQAQAGALEGQISSLRAAFDARFEATDRRVSELAQMQRSSQTAFDARFDEALRGRDQTSVDLAARQADLVAGIRRIEAQIAMAPDPTLIGSMLRGVLQEGFAEIGRTLETATQAAAFAANAERQDTQNAVMGEMRALTQTLETSLGRGLNEMASAFQNGLALYADLMRQTQPREIQTDPIAQARDAG